MIDNLNSRNSEISLEDHSSCSQLHPCFYLMKSDKNLSQTRDDYKFTTLWTNTNYTERLTKVLTEVSYPSQCFSARGLEANCRLTTPSLANYTTH